MNAKHLQCWETCGPIDNIERCIRDGHPALVLMRGLPGSGKSHLARQLAALSSDSAIYSTDDLFTQNGTYTFDFNKLQEYHDQNIVNVRKALKDGQKLIIVDNTNIAVAHMKPYAASAAKHYYEIFVVEPQTEWKESVKECTRRNSHGVPKEVVKRMLDEKQVEGKITLQVLLGKNVTITLNPPLEDEPFDMNILKPNLIGNASEKPILLKAPPGLEIDKKKEQVTTEDALSKKFLSLGVETIPRFRTVSYRNSATQTITEIDRLIGTNYIDQVEDSYTIKYPVEHKPLMIDRVAVAEETGVSPKDEPSELDKLCCLFPCSSKSSIYECYSAFGLESTVSYFRQAGEEFVENAIMEKGAFDLGDAQIEVSQTFRSCHNVLNPIPEELYMPASRNRGPTSEDLVSVKIGKQLSGELKTLFGNHQENEPNLPTEIKLPLWLLYDLYRACHGQVRSAREQDNYDIEVESDDMMLARALHETETSPAGPIVGEFTAAQKEHLSRLYGYFPSLNKETVNALYRDVRGDFQAAFDTLKLHCNLEHIYHDVPVNNVIYSNSPKANHKRSHHNHLHNDKHGSNVFEEAHRIAKENMHVATMYDKKRFEETQKFEQTRRQNATKLGAAYYSLNASECAKKMHERIKDSAEVIKQANRRSKHLDLHYLTQKDALDVVKERLAMLDRHESERNRNPGKSLRIVTGYGKETGKAILRSAVISYLKRNNYKFSFPHNMGEVVVECK